MLNAVIQRSVRMIQLMIIPSTWLNAIHPFQSQFRGGGRYTLKDGVDERRERRTLCEDEDQTKQRDEEDQRKQPPLLADAHEVPEVDENGELGHVGGV